MLIAQLSDLHIRPAGQLYKGVADSSAMFGRAIEHLQGLDQKPDLVLLTGDLVDEGRPDEYEHAVQLLGALSIPYLIMPGNHDHRGHLRAAFPAHDYLGSSGPINYCIDAYPVRIVALDTTIVNLHHGDLDALSLSWLAETLAEAPNKPTLVLMHHPPFVSGIVYLDKYRYFDSQALEKILRSFSNIEAVLCGHVHRSMVRRWAGTVVLSCPSTATEIALQFSDCAKPQSHLAPPACLLHLWNPEQGLISHMSLIGRYPGPYPFA